MQHPSSSDAPQAFTSSRASNSPFTPKGLRSFWEYRDLGVADGTHGKWRATVLRAAKPCPDGGTGWHFHELDFQMYYILGGTMRTQVDGMGTLTFGAGDAFMQPPGTRHCVEYFSEGLEMLELMSPAEYGTQECEVPSGAGHSGGNARSGGQHFTTSFADSSVFESGGLRSYFEYRDLGFNPGSGGLVQAHVLRAVKPCPPGGTGWHLHELQFQFIYVLSGSITTHLEGQGPLTFSAGDSWTQPPAIRHCVVDYSGDLSMLEFVSPAEFATVDSKPPR